MVSTYSFKQENAPDLSKASKGSIKMMELQRLKICSLNKRILKLLEGLKGIKGYGTFSKVDDKSNSSTNCIMRFIV